MYTYIYIYLFHTLKHTFGKKWTKNAQLVGPPLALYHTSMEQLQIFFNAAFHSAVQETWVKVLSTEELLRAKSAWKQKCLERLVFGLKDIVCSVVRLYQKHPKALGDLLLEHSFKGTYQLAYLLRVGGAPETKHVKPLNWIGTLTRPSPKSGESHNVRNPHATSPNLHCPCTSSISTGQVDLLSSAKLLTAVS